jgi:hypothetical protein
MREKDVMRCSKKKNRIDWTHSLSVTQRFLLVREEDRKGTAFVPVLSSRKPVKPPQPHSGGHPVSCACSPHRDGRSIPSLWRCRIPSIRTPAADFPARAATVGLRGGTRITRSISLRPATPTPRCLASPPPNSATSTRTSARGDPRKVRAARSRSLFLVSIRGYPGCLIVG